MCTTQKAETVDTTVSISSFFSFTTPLIAYLLHHDSHMVCFSLPFLGEIIFREYSPQEGYPTVLRSANGLQRLLLGRYLYCSHVRARQRWTSLIIGNKNAVVEMPERCRRCSGNIEEDIHTAGRTVSLDNFGADTFTSFFQVMILPTKLQTRWPHCDSRSRVTGRVWIFTGLLLTSTPSDAFVVFASSPRSCTHA